MPLYIYEHPETKEIKEVLQSMKDKHEYSENGVTWNRVFVKPNASFDTSIDPNDAKAFVKKTDNKGMKLGDMWDLSKALSEKREKSRGIDPIKKKATDEYYKKCKKPHPLAHK